MTMKQQLLRHYKSLLCPYQYQLLFSLSESSYYSKNESYIASVVSYKSSFIRQRQRRSRMRRRYYHNTSTHIDDNNNTASMDADFTATATATVDPPDVRINNININNNTSISSISSTIPYMGQGIKVGQYATVERSYKSEDVDNFGRLIQDFNPLHSSSSSSSSSSSTSSSTSSSSTSSSSTSSSNNINDHYEEKHDNNMISSSLLQLQRDVHENAGLIQYEEEEEEEDNADADAEDCDVDIDTNKIRPTKALVHGIFVSSIFSSMFANIAPGCVYINQSLDFVSPIFVHDIIIGCISIEKIRRRRGDGIVVQCQTRVYKYKNIKNNRNNNDDDDDNDVGRKILQQPSHAQIAVKGHANVWLPVGYKQQ